MVWNNFIDQRGGGPIVFYHGCHVDCGYFITGEHREYLKNGGVFGPVHVNHPIASRFTKEGQTPGWGAWELTSRFSYLDFFDPHTPLGPNGQLVGVEMSQATFGVNWYLADHLRVMFNYSYVVPTEPNTGASVANIFSIAASRCSGEVHHVSS